MENKMKCYGISEIIKHPQGWSYVVAYLCEEKKLSNSLMLCAWWNDTKEMIKIED